MSQSICITESNALLFFLLLDSSACGTVNRQENGADLSADTIGRALVLEKGVTQVRGDVTDPIDLVGDQVETYYVIIADTGFIYHSLRDKMFRLHQQVGNPIDKMRRSYNEAKNLIALSDDDEDDIYRGDYFPRRFASNALSLEYLRFYEETSLEKSIALVAGIYETKDSSDSALASVRKYNPKLLLSKLKYMWAASIKS